jgi:hypothetical protein
MSEAEKRSYLLFNSIDIHLADARREFTKLENGKVKVAATRTRKQLASVTDHIKELRKLALSIQKELPITKRPVKAAAEEEESAAESDEESEEGEPLPKEKPKVRKHRKSKAAKKE